VGPNSPDVLDDGSNGSRGIDLVDGSIGVVQDGNFTNAKHSGGGSKFRFTHSADFSRLDLVVW